MIWQQIGIESEHWIGPLDLTANDYSFFILGFASFV